jgi:hypothetical protein
MTSRIRKKTREFSSTRCWKETPADLYCFHSLAGQMALMKGERVKRITDSSDEDDDEDDEESGTDDDEDEVDDEDSDSDSD